MEEKRIIGVFERKPFELGQIIKHLDEYVEVYKIVSKDDFFKNHPYYERFISYNECPYKNFYEIRSC